MSYYKTLKVSDLPDWALITLSEVVASSRYYYLCEKDISEEEFLADLRALLGDYVEVPINFLV